jgi:hypothetical protein
MFCPTLRFVATAVFVGALSFAGAALAQPQPASQPQPAAPHEIAPLDVLQRAGIPEYPAQGTDSTFYSKKAADGVSLTLKLARAAADKCDQKELDRLKALFDEAIATALAPKKAGEDDVSIAQGRVTADILQRVLDKDFPKLPAKCLPPAPPAVALPGSPEATPTAPPPEPRAARPPKRNLDDCVATDADVKAAQARVERAEKDLDEADNDIPRPPGRKGGIAVAARVLRQAEAEGNLQAADQALDKAIKAAEEKCAEKNAEKKRVGMMLPGSGSRSLGSFSLIGGGQLAASGRGYVTGIDRSQGQGNFNFQNNSNNLIIDNRDLGGGAVFGLIGIRARVELAAAFALVSSQPFLPGNPWLNYFFETGIQFGLGDAYYATFSGVNTGGAGGFGNFTVHQNFQIPLLAGVGISVGELMPHVPLYLDLYGGILISNTTQTLQGRETAAPTGSLFFSQQGVTTVEPMIGAGVRLPISGTPISVGANLEAALRQGMVTSAQSPNFNTQSYVGTRDSGVDLIGTIRTSVSF